MKLLVTVIVLVLLTALAIAFNVRNPADVSLRLCCGIEGEVSTFVAVTVPFVLGMFVGGGLVGFSLFRQKLKTGKANRALSKVEKEVEGLRASSTTDSSS